MILNLFLVFIGISLVLIIVGLTKPSESAQAIIGFLFLFLLSVGVLLPGNLQYPSGMITNTTYTYVNASQINMTSEITTYQYDNFEDEKGASGFGYWLAIASAVGMAGVFYSLKNTNWREE